MLQVLTLTGVDGDTQHSLLASLVQLTRKRSSSTRSDNSFTAKVDSSSSSTHHTYSLPVDSTPSVLSTNISTEIYRRPVYRSPPAVRRARRPDHPTRPPDTSAVPAPAAAPSLHHERQTTCTCTCRLHSSTGCKSRSRSRERRLLGMGDLESVLVGGVSGAGGRGVGVASVSGRKVGVSGGNGNNSGRNVGGSANNSSGGLGLPTAGKSGASGGRGKTVGGASGRDIGRGSASKGTNGGGGRRSVHQKPGFLKTVSIIETLSELAHGPEVQRLAQEPRPQRPSRPHSGSRASSSRQPTLTTSAGGGSAGDHGDDTPTRPPGPPVLSADFQQYSEKIYDAVTSQGPEPSLRGNHGGQGRVHSIAHPRRRERTQPRGETALGESQGAPGISKESRREEEEISRKPRPEHRGRERGRTPDWIKRIFDIAKKGDLPSLKRSVVDMEGTLIRNLSDHSGNNLLHVMAVFGHLAPLAWLLTSQQVLVDALHDENKFGLTPLVCAIKYGRLRLVQWMVENTGVRDKVRCKDGERSLLHVGAKYAQEEVVGWLVEYMMAHEVPLDNKDHNGNTALHLAARTGNSRVCSILLQHGADVTLKSGLALATDLTRREAELEAAMADNHDLRVNFKEVLSVARRLVKEREEVVRELSRLHDHMVEAHDNNIMALQVLAEENNSLRDRVNGVRQSTHAREQVESVIEYVNGLHERWQGAQKTWFGSSLVDMEHRMLLVEEAWKKLRHRSHRTVATAHHPLDVFRAKLCSIRAQGGDCRLGDLPSLCSSEESLVSLFPFSEEEDVYEGVEDYAATTSPAHSTPTRATTLTSTPMRTPASGGVDVRSETLPARLEALSPRVGRSDHIQEPDYLSRSEANLADEPPDPIIDHKQSPISSRSRNPASKVKDSPGRPYWADASLSPGLGLISEQLAGNSPSGERLGKEEVSARLRELALTSESGSCSVLEVIEPSSDESDAAPEDDPGSLDPQIGPRGAAPPRASEESSSGEAKALRLPHDRRQKRGPRARHDEGESSVRGGEATTTSSESGADSTCVKQVDLLHGTDHPHHLRLHHTDNTDHKHFLVNETSPGAAAADVSDICGQRHLGDGEGMESTLKDTSVGVTSVYKRKGFLHKFSIKPRWPSKRKVKTVRKVPELSARDFQETYGNVRESTLSLGDTDAHTTTESNTSSSQEYSNSSEESSIGKPTTSTTTTSSSTVTARPSDLPEAEAARHRTRSGASSSDKHIEHGNSSITSNPGMSGSCPSSPPPLPARRKLLPEDSSPATPPSSAPPIPPEPEFESMEENLPPVPEEAVLKPGSEARSVAASEDSGIVARPASSASKSDSVSRPESSSSSFPPFKSDYPLQKGFSLTQDLLPTPDSSTAGRMSPAPSEISKTESALSPPSHASDVSKSESARQLSVGKGSVGGSTSVSSKEGSASSSSDYSLTLLPLKKQLNVKTAAIIDISCEQKTKKPDQPSISSSTRGDSGSSKKEEKPWYELSDEESDILLPDRLTSKVIPRHSSSEDETEVC
ncbi:Synphilin-1-like [Homarus americanus]|uniref:Synphilin-1-like n=1 Tax=Homarus americanus TaxID=6706 RepID=A0A8J5JPR0_HOMAM|nr:Synphilin-1-like [Homarus americanus]